MHILHITDCRTKTTRYSRPSPSTLTSTPLRTASPRPAPTLRSPGGATSQTEKSTPVHTAKNPHQSHQSQPKTNTSTHKRTNEKVFGVKNSVVARPPSVLPSWFSYPETTGCRLSPCGVPCGPCHTALPGYRCPRPNALPAPGQTTAPCQKHLPQRFKFSKVF